MPGLRIIVALVAGALLVPQVAAAQPVSMATDVCTLPPEERPAALAEPVQLCGVTRISGEQSARIRVHIPRSLNFEIPLDEPLRRPIYDESSPIQISGAGRVLGLALVEERYSEEHPGLPTGSATLFYTVPEAPIAPTTIDEVGDVWRCNPHAGTCAIPAGNYRIYLIADNGPVTVTLRFPQLPGSVDLAPTVPAEMDVWTLPKRTEVNQEGHVAVIASDSRTSPRPGALVVWSWLSHTGTPVLQGRTVQSCWYRGEITEPAAYAPGCPWTSLVDEGYAGVLLPSVTPAGNLGGATVTVLPKMTGRDGATTYSIGAHMTSRASGQRYEAVGIALDFS